MSDIQKVAVLGAGTMGRGIAGLCANAGCEVVLMDRNTAACDDALRRLVSGTSPVLEDESRLEYIQTGSFDDMGMISECDWICEGVVEDVAVKRDMFTQVENHRRDGSIVTSGTSGIPLRILQEGMSDRLQRDSAVTHFFNPAHVMKLVELVPGPRTNILVIIRLADFLGRILGKGVVYAKDTPNFIANRIAAVWVNVGMNLGESAVLKEGLDLETVDALFGEPIGMPSTGLYGLADLVGIDVMMDVTRNLEKLLPEEDAFLRFFRTSPSIMKMYERGQLGRKTGGGFYRLVRNLDGNDSLETFDFATQKWRERRKVTLDPATHSLTDLFNRDDAGGRLVRELMISTLCYAADHVPQIADDIVNVDRAMRWGYAWNKGPFQLIDEIGANTLIDIVKERDMLMPNMLRVLKESGNDSFYRDGGRKFLNVRGNWEPTPLG